MTANDSYEVTKFSKVRRLPARGTYDKGQIDGILKEGLTCHVAFVADGRPVCIPMIYAVLEDKLYVHGSIASRLLKSMKAGVEVCVTVTLVDGLVLARSGFHHSMNYRSVSAFGVAEPVTDSVEKERVLGAVVEHIIPGRNAQLRQATDAELQSTSLLSLKLEEVSAKVRTGGPRDDEEDYKLPIWAGVLPLSTAVTGQPIADARLPVGVNIPPHVTHYSR
ncbi:hypothetical protein WJX74_005395 [Apatococcus lobatus]|uniref:Pyridoxamine 5'-phosphate oxidase family protein n=2 Tax=Apatococcus TaxID=904362 RepID=A0AAW1T5H3_9CHLO